MTRLHVLPHTKLPQDCRVYILKHKLLEKVQSMERNREQAMLCWGGGGGGEKVFKEKKKSNTQCTESGAFQRLESTLLMP